MRGRVLIVDDVEINRVILGEILKDDYDISESSGGREAVDVILKDGMRPDIILLDIIMPDMDGYEVIRLLKEDSLVRNIPVLFITAADTDTNETRALNAGALDFISKPFNSDVVKARVANHVQLSNYHRLLESMVEEKTEEINNLHHRILDTLATIVEYRSLEFGHHISRVKVFANILVERMLLKPKFQNILLDENYKELVRAVTLHDIGKIGISDAILLKPGKLTAEEFNIMKTHTTLGGNIIDSIAQGQGFDQVYLKHCRDIALYHHERWDGTGYMNGLKGDEIPISARIVSVVDVYDAVSSKRCYKDSYSHSDTIDIIIKGKGSQFDPDIVECFLEVESEIEKLAFGLRDNKTN